MTLLPSRLRSTRPATPPRGRHALDGRHSAEIPGGIPVATWITPPAAQGGRHRAGAITRLVRTIGLLAALR